MGYFYYLEDVALKMLIHQGIKAVGIEEAIS